MTATTDNIPNGIFIYENKFKVLPGVTKKLGVQFVSKPGCLGNGSGQMKLLMEPGALSYTIKLHTRVINKLKDDLFSGKDSPGTVMRIISNKHFYLSEKDSWKCSNHTILYFLPIFLVCFPTILFLF